MPWEPWPVALPVLLASAYGEMPDEDAVRAPRLRTRRAGLASAIVDATLVQDGAGNVVAPRRRGLA